MKKLFNLLLCILVCTTVQAASLKLIGCDPVNNSEISSFEFVLKFDLSEIREAETEIAANLGVGFSGTSKINTVLYKGNKETGEVLGTALTKTRNGKSDGFDTSGEIKISFPDINPEEGVEYTLVINNSFRVYESGKSTGTDYRYTDVPITYTFIGANNSSNLVLISSSISNNEKLEEINSIKLTFNLPIVVSCDAEAQLMIDGDLYTTTSSFAVDLDDHNSVIISFDNMPLYKNSIYQFICNAGSIIMKDDESKSNEEILITLQGNAAKPFSLKSKNPETRFNGILVSASVQYELPENNVLLETYGASTISYPAILYKINGEEKIEISNLNGKPLSSRDGIEWAINCEILPETEYLITVPANSIFAYVSDATFIGGYKKNIDMSNEEINFSFATPSIENCNLPQLEFSVPFTSDTDGRNRIDYPITSEVSEFNALHLELTDKFYYYNGKSYSLIRNNQTSELCAVLYKISDSGERIKIKDINCGVNTIYIMDSYYLIATLSIDSRLYEDTHYQVVIPAGIYTVTNDVLKNFVQNDEIRATASKFS